MSTSAVNNRKEALKLAAESLIRYLKGDSGMSPEVAVCAMTPWFSFLEMWRYDAFSDRPHRGVTDLNGDFLTMDYDENWHEGIVGAIQRATISEDFPNQEKVAVIDNLQAALRELAQQGEGGSLSQRKLCNFFTRFIDAVER